MEPQYRGLVVWDVDGTLIPADLRWLRRAISRAYGLAEQAVAFPAKKVHGYTDESIAVDAAVASGITRACAEEGIPRFRYALAAAMASGREELRAVQPAYPGAIATIAALHHQGFAQTVLTGNIRVAAETKLAELGLDVYLDLDIGGYGSDERDRLRLPSVVTRRFGRKYGTPLVAQKTVVIGDAPNDIACARHAGFWVTVVTHRTSREELSKHDPDAIIEQLEPATVTSLVQSLVGRS